MSKRSFKLTCAHCSVEFVRSKAQRPGMNAYCSSEHQRLGQAYTTGRAFSKSGPYEGVHVCPTCNEDFQAHHPSVVYCSKKCQSRAANARTAQRWAERAVVGDGYNPKWRKQYKEALLVTQKHCNICKIDFALLDLKQIHVDHDHETGRLRGLLCSSCNQGLGNFKDNIERLELAIQYLQEWSDKEVERE